MKPHLISRFLFITYMFFLLNSLTSEASVPSTLIKLNPGADRVIDLGKAPRAILISNPNVLDVERVGASNSVRLMPRSKGKATLTLEFPAGEETKYEIIVGNIDSSLPSGKISSLSLSVGARLAKDLQKISAIEAIVEDGKIIVIGQVTSLEHFNQISKIIAKNRPLFLLAYTFSLEAESQILAEINKNFLSLGEPNLLLFCKQGNYFLTGSLIFEENKEKIIDYLANVLPGVTDFTRNEVSKAEVFQLQIGFLEVSKAGHSNIGASWSGMHEKHVSSSQLLPDFAMQVAPISVMVNALKENSAVREIASPTIIARHGQKAKFLAGGETPILTKNDKEIGNKVEFKPYGIIFSAIPFLQTDGSINLDLSAEFSSVDEGITLNGVPSFSSRKIETGLILNQGYAALLTGFVRNRNVKQAETFPGLSAIPIIGELFKNRRFKNEETELWISVAYERALPKIEKDALQSLYEKNKANTEGSWRD